VADGATNRNDPSVVGGPASCQLTIGGIAAEVTYCGAAPGEVDRVAAALGDLEVDVAQDTLDGGGETRKRAPAGHLAARRVDDEEWPYAGHRRQYTSAAAASRDANRRASLPPNGRRQSRLVSLRLTATRGHVAHHTARASYEQLTRRLNKFPVGAPPSELLYDILAMLFTEREARLVHIYSFRFTSYQEPLAQFSIACTKGTYVRSIAHELGQKLGCGAHLASLRRVASGKFNVASALPLSEVIKLTPRELEKHVLPFLQVARG